MFEAFGERNFDKFNRVDVGERIGEMMVEAHSIALLDDWLRSATLPTVGNFRPGSRAGSNLRGLFQVAQPKAVGALDQIVS